MYIKISILQNKIYRNFQEKVHQTILKQHNYMNISRLEQLVKDSGKSKVQIAKLSGITRVTLDNALQGGDVRVSIIEAIAKTLGVKVGYLFDDDAIGQNAIAQGNSSIAAINSDVKVGKDDSSVLQERVKHLEELLAEKERLIKVYERMMEGK